MRGIFLEADLLHSEAFKSLSRWSLRVYLGFLSKRVIIKSKDKARGVSHTVANNGKIEFCYSTAEADGIPRREFRSAIDSLIELGFIDLAHQGAGGRSRDKSLYGVSERWRKWGKPDFQQAEKIRVKNTKAGQGWQLYNGQIQKKSVTKLSPVNPLSSDKTDTSKERKQVYGVTKATPEKEHQKAVNA